MTQVQIKIITLFVVGLLLGPTYHLYCSLFSGQSLITNTLNEISDRWVLDDHSIFRISSGISYQPLEMPLTPNENNVIIEISCKPNPCNQIDEMTLSLSSGSNVAFREVLEINSFFPFSDFTTGPDLYWASRKIHDFGRTKINKVERTFNRTSCQKKCRITQYYFACDRLWILSAAMFIFTENFSNKVIKILSF
jgi:hypothetical protein